MADNVAITAGVGTSIATDDVSGDHYQKIKLYDATDGASGVMFVAPASITDALSNPTATRLAVLNMVYAPSGGTALWDRQRTPNIFIAIDLSGATAETTIWTPASGRKFRWMGLVFSTGGATKLTFKDNTGGTTIAYTHSAGTTHHWFEWGNGILSAAANNVLTLTRGTNTTFYGVAFGTEE